MPYIFVALKKKMEEFDQEWQFQYCFGAVDGCHLTIKCPNGGLESCKEYHNFKTFYSIAIMAIVDANYQFMWASSGYPGNSHDAMILQSANLFHKMKNKSVILSYYKEDDSVDIYLTLVGDSAFPFLPWLMKPYGSTTLT